MTGKTFTNARPTAVEAKPMAEVHRGLLQRELRGSGPKLNFLTHRRDEAEAAAIARRRRRERRRAKVPEHSRSH